MVVSWGWDEKWDIKNESMCMDDSFWGVEIVLKLDNGHGYTALSVY